MDILKEIIDLVYPAFCHICKTKLDPEEDFVCGKCLRRIEYIKPPFCIRCGRHLPFEKYFCWECADKRSRLRRVYALGVYDHVLKECIHTVKYHRKKYLLKLFKNRIIAFIRENMKIDEIDIITYVPMHRRKFEERSFNQSAEIASMIGRHFKIPVLELLEKTRVTEPQHLLSKGERAINVYGTFSVCGKESLEGKSVLITDDIFTTGSTMNECAKMLRSKKAKAVYGFVLGRGN